MEVFIIYMLIATAHFYFYVHAFNDFEDEIDKICCGVFTSLAWVASIWFTIPYSIYKNGKRRKK